MHRLLAALLVCSLTLFAISPVYSDSDFLLDDFHVSEVDRNLTELLSRHESGEITQEEFELEAANLILNSGEDPTLRHAAVSDDSGSSSWHDTFAVGQDELSSADNSYLYDNCFIDEAGLVNINGTEDCDLLVSGVDVHADSLPGGIDGEYKLVSCFNGKPMYKRMNSPEGEARTLWYSVMYGDWEFSYGEEPSEDQLLLYGDFASLSPLDVPDWHLAAALNSREVLSMPSEDEDLYFIIPRVDVVCADGSHAERIKEHYDTTQFTTLGAHIPYEEHTMTLEEVTGESAEEYAASKVAENERALEEEDDAAHEEGTCGGNPDEEGVWQDEELPDEKDIGIFADLMDQVTEDDGGCGAEYEDEGAVPVLPGEIEEEDDGEKEDQHEGPRRFGGYGLDELDDEDDEEEDDEYEAVGDEKDEL